MFPERLLDVVIDEAGTRSLEAGHASSVETASEGLSVKVAGRVLPRYLTTRDHGWVEHALDLVDACVGRPRAEVEASLAEAPGRGEGWRAWRALCFLLLRLHGFEVRACRKPGVLREAAFSAAGDAGPQAQRGVLLEQVATQLDVTASEIEQGLYADLPAARLLRARSQPLSTPELLERYNLALAQGLLWRAEVLQIRLGGQLKAVLRMARLRGLLCLAERDARTGEAVLRLSGPLALFHQTTKYGRAMAAWLPVLIRAPRWSLRARCVLGGRRLLWSAGSRDPIGTTHVPPRRFDSKLEARLFRDLKRTAPHWEVLREADAVQVGRRIVSPDFTLVDARRALRISVEVVGFWTEAYLRDKLSVLEKLPISVEWILCVDDSLAVARDEPAFAKHKVLWFRGKIDAEALLALIEERVRSGVGRSQRANARR